MPGWRDGHSWQCPVFFCHTPLVTTQDCSSHVLDKSALYSDSLSLVVSAGIAAAGGNARTHHQTPANCRRQ